MKSFLLALGLSLLSIPQASQAAHFGVITDLQFVCSQCYDIFKPGSWEAFAASRDANFVKITDLTAADLVTQLKGIDVLLLSLPDNAPKAMTELPAAAKETLRLFVAQGGVLISQNSFEGKPSTNMTTLSYLFGFKSDTPTYSLENNYVISQTAMAQQNYPGIPATLGSPFRFTGYKNLDPKFDPIYVYNGITAVAVAPYELGAVIIYGLANDMTALSKEQQDLLEFIAQVAKAPVY